MFQCLQYVPNKGFPVPPALGAAHASFGSVVPSYLHLHVGGPKNVVEVVVVVVVAGHP